MSSPRTSGSAPTSAIPGRSSRRRSRALAARPGVELRAVSSAYESDPVGPVSDQPPFLNAVAVVGTTLAPGALLRGAARDRGHARAHAHRSLRAAHVRSRPAAVRTHRAGRARPAASRTRGSPSGASCSSRSPSSRRCSCCPTAGGCADLLAAVADQGVRRLDGPPSVLPCVPRGYHEREPGPRRADPMSRSC